MRTLDLIKRSLKYYWRTNLAVVFGVATAVAVLAGALLVGDSVRASLRDLFLQRLGQTDHVITTTSFFREQLAEDIRPKLVPPLSNSCSLIEMDGTVSRDNGARAGGVRVYGVDRRFWQFHGIDQTTPENRQVLVSDTLARELNTRASDTLLIRIQKPSDIPLESLFGRKEDAGRTLRVTIREILSPAQLGEFSTRPQQSGVRAVFVPLQLLQKELGQEGRVNTILLSSSKDTGGLSEAEKTKALAGLLKDVARLEDYNIKLRILDQQQSPTGAQASRLQAPTTETVAIQSSLSVEDSTGMISEALAKKVDEAARQAGSVGVSPYLSYLVNSMRLENGRAIPYSIVTAVHGETFEVIQHHGGGPIPGCATDSELPPLILNEWAAKDLGAKVKDRITLDYYVWLEQGQLATRSAEFSVACIIPMEGIAADRNLVPDYPGITESEHLSDWDPPFPIDLDQIRPQDEAYWKQFRTTPKAFLPLSAAQKLWQSRFGNLTSLRVYPNRGQDLAQMHSSFEEKLLKSLDPSQMGFAILPVRAEGLAASRGATDFGEYFLYFSFFLVVSALLLASLFFKFGIEQRLREIGTLQAVGFSAARIRGLFLTEGLFLSLFGSLLGLLGAVAYGYVILFGLRTWWVDAVGTTQLRLYVSPLSLLLGGIGGVLAAVICVALTLRGLGRASSRSLLTGVLIERTQRHGDAETRRFSSWRLRVAILLTVIALLVLLAAALSLIGQVAGFFGGGALLLTALLLYVSASLRRPRRKSIHGTGWPAISRLGIRNSMHRPARSVLCIALIAMSAFIIVAVDAFRHTNRDLGHDRKSGSGGFPLVAESVLPMVYDPNSETGREALGLSNNQTASAVAKSSFTRFRLRPGDDASCLNLYQPRNPRILGVTAEFIQSNRFTFQKSLATSPEETVNPWLLLNHNADDAVPVIADANSMTYVLHLGVGDELTLNRGAGPVRLRLVGALANSIFQSELMMSEENFVRLFPDQAGYRFFLIDTPERDLPAITTALENRLSDYGFDVTSTAERLANFHRVENTYLSTFQMLGGLGLLLGTMGLSAVLLRNVLERRKELALLRAVGYNSTHFAIMVIAENTFLLVLGLAIGTTCALLAIAPALLNRGGRLPNVSLGLLLLTVLISGLTASLVATWAALKSPLLPALRTE